MKRRDSEQIYITRDELAEIIDEQWAKLGSRLEVMIADAMEACARAWIPDHQKHVAEAAIQLHVLSGTRLDGFITDVERGIATRLKNRSRLH
jgi:hypothetical protein